MCNIEIHSTMKYKINNLALVLFVLSTMVILGSTIDAFAVDPDGRGEDGSGILEACLNAMDPPNFFPCDTADEWSGGNISTGGGYKEGSSIPMRVDITGLEDAPYQQVIFEYQITKIQGGDVQHAFDYITSFNNNDDPHPCLVAHNSTELEACDNWEWDSIVIPTPASTTVGINTTTTILDQPGYSFDLLTDSEKSFYIFSPNGTTIDITGIGYVSGHEGDPSNSQNSQLTQLYVNYTTNSPDVIAAFGLHVASPNMWDLPATVIDGKGFHIDCTSIHSGGGCTGPGHES